MDESERQKEVFRRISEHIDEGLSNIQTMFREMDKDGKGGITRKELTQGLDSIGLELTEAELKACFDCCDANGDDHIVYQDLTLTLTLLTLTHIVYQDLTPTLTLTLTHIVYQDLTQP